MIIHPHTAKALEKQRREELRVLTERDALQATEQLLDMAAKATYPPEKERSADLIMRQRILYGITT
jgi:hypothetical protein